MMGQADYLDLGSWNAVCDRCGGKFKASQLTKTWDQLMCCSKCWEPRQPQDFVRAVKDTQTPPWTRPGGGDIFVGVCTPRGASAFPELAVPGCAIPDYIPGGFNPNDLGGPCIPWFIEDTTYIAPTADLTVCHTVQLDASLYLDGTLRIR
jgi:hypothetical protein